MYVLREHYIRHVGTDAVTELMQMLGKASTPVLGANCFVQPANETCVVLTVS